MRNGREYSFIKNRKIFRKEKNSETKIFTKCGPIMNIVTIEDAELMKDDMEKELTSSS